MRRRRKVNFIFFLSLAMLVIWVVVFSMIAGTVGQNTAADQEASLEQALDHAITNCYALEGMYPPDLDYMKEHYGLIYDEDLFYVDYRPIASNIRPDYFIIVKTSSGSSSSGIHGTAVPGIGQSPAAASSGKENS